MLKTKASRLMFLITLAINFLLIHFTRAWHDMLPANLGFREIVETTMEHPLALPYYLACLLLPPFLLAWVLPLLANWVRSGR